MEKTTTQARPWRVLPLSILITVTLFLSIRCFPQRQTSLAQFSKPSCPIPDIVRPSSYYSDNSTLEKIIHNAEFRNQSAAKLSGAVRVPTEIGDMWPGPQEDPERWEKFVKFHTYLETTFPLVFQSKDFTVEKVNVYGYVVTWHGSSLQEKPLLFMAHQDVVPVQKETLSDWTYPPFDGVYDGETVWGRGSSDCKNTLTGMLEAIEELIKDGFKPQRTVILSFGFDEEAGGLHGADSIAPFLKERYGPDSFVAIVDEGGTGFKKIAGRAFAIPSTGEKGYLDGRIGLTTPGGHSSIPPDHTAIGIASELITRIENSPFPYQISGPNPAYQYLTCLAEHTDNMTSSLRSSILDALFDKSAREETYQYISSDKGLNALFKTTQAVDVINGGAKANALPEHVSIVLNQRIAIESSIKETVSHLVNNHMLPVAKSFNLGLEVINYTGEQTVLRNATENGHFVLDARRWLNPAPSSPTDNDVWMKFAGTIRHLYEDIVFPDLEEPLVVSPGIMSGNTDTKAFWDFTENIYRYQPGTLDTLIDTKAHSVDEHINIDSHLQVIAFYYELVRNFDS